MEQEEGPSMERVEAARSCSRSKLPKRNDVNSFLVESNSYQKECLNEMKSQAASLALIANELSLMRQAYCFTNAIHLATDNPEV